MKDIQSVHTMCTFQNILVSHCVGSTAVVCGKHHTSYKHISFLNDI